MPVPTRRRDINPTQQYRVWQVCQAASQPRPLRGTGWSETTPDLVSHAHCKMGGVIVKGGALTAHI